VNGPIFTIVGLKFGNFIILFYSNIIPQLKPLLVGTNNEK